MLIGLLEPAVVALGYELADLELTLGRHGVVRLFIDCEAGVTLDDCETVSRQISGLLDVEDPIPGDYRLEVSSPGLDRKLVKPEHFDRFSGSSIRARFRHLRDGRRQIQGQLLGRDGDCVLLKADDQTLVIPMQDIAVARLVPE